MTPRQPRDNPVRVRNRPPPRFVERREERGYARVDLVERHVLEKCKNGNGREEPVGLSETHSSLEPTREAKLLDE